MVFLEQMRLHGHDGGLLMIPGSVADFTGAQLNSLTHPMPVDEVEAIFTTGKADYIAAYAQRMAPVLARRRPAGRRRPASRCWNHCARCSSRSWCRATRSATVSAIPSSCGWVRRLSCWTSPNVLCANLFRMKFRYGFEIAPELVRTVLRDEEPDWVNTIFLSTRFRAWRVGGYNEYLYTFFKCLTDERIAYADGWFAETHDDTATITLDGWEIQRRCPHLKADLSKFGVVEDSTLTCNLHGWQWDLATGRCLTARGHQLRCSRT